MAASQLPHYYSELKPSQELFLTGLPILTYHHVGPRPSGVRIKGLYVNPRLFKSQLDELARAGFSAPAYDPVKLVEQPPVRNVLLTFDDGFVDVFNHALPVLNRTGFKAIEFLVSDLVGKT